MSIINLIFKVNLILQVLVKVEVIFTCMYLLTLLAYYYLMCVCGCVYSLWWQTAWCIRYV